MFPTDREFTILYFGYLLVFLYLFIKVLQKKEKIYILNLIVHLGLSVRFVLLLADEKHFKYGGSLGVLFYGTFFLVSHLVVLWIMSMTKLKLE